MIISCCWIYAISRYGYPPSIQDTFRALRDMRQLGFRYMELEGVHTDNTRAVYENRKELKKFCDDSDITLLNFSPVLPDLFSNDKATAARGLDDFRLSLELADYFGAGSVQVDSFTPPFRFKGKKPYTGETFEYDQTYAIEIDDDFCYDAYYEHMVNIYRKTAELAADAGKLCIVEPRVGENIYSADSFLRLYDHVGNENLAVVLDVAHLNAAKEIIPYSVEKLGKHIRSVHAADNDSRSNVHLAVGEGNVDWDATLAALKKHDFSGYIALDVANIPNLDEGYLASRDYLEAVMKRLGIPCEY